MISTTSDNVSLLSRSRLRFLALVWLLSGAVIAVLAVLSSPYREPVENSLALFLGVVQLSFLMEKKEAKGRLLISISGALLALMGVAILAMGELISWPLVRIFVGGWIIGVLVFNAYAIGSLGSLTPRSVAAFVRAAALIAGLISIALYFFVAHEFGLGLLVAAYLLTIGFAISQLARAT